MSAEEFAKLWHQTCEEVGPRQDPCPTVILPWDELSDGQRALKTAVAKEFLNKLRDRKKCPLGREK